MPEGKSPKSERRILPGSRLVGAGETRQLLSSLVHLAGELNASLDLDDILDRVMRRSRDVMGARGSVLMFLDRDANELAYRVSLADGDNFVQQPVGIPVGTGIAGHVASTGKAYRASDVTRDKHFSPETDRIDGLETSAVLCVPLKTQQEGMIGVAMAINRVDGREFSDDDEDFFQAFADMAAVSIANARLHKEAVEKRKLEREMSVARDIQQSFLPSGFPEVEGLAFEATMRPAFHVGGDFYDVFPMKGGKACVVIGDVSGKGASAALYMACLHSELRLVSDFDPDPQHILHRLNDITFNRSRRGSYITLLLAVLDPQRGTARLLSAGHPEPLLFDPGTRTASFVPTRNGFPLGVMTNQQYEEVEIDFPAGSVLLGFTDGVTEARNPASEEFGIERLGELFQRTVTEGHDVVATVHKCIETFAGDAEQYDDITLVAVHATETA